MSHSINLFNIPAPTKENLHARNSRCYSHLNIEKRIHFIPRFCPNPSYFTPPALRQRKRIVDVSRRRAVSDFRGPPSAEQKQENLSLDEEEEGDLEEDILSDDEYFDSDDEEDYFDEDEADNGDVELATLKPKGNEDEYLQIGIVMGAHGLKGELRVRSYTDFPEKRFQEPGLRWVRRPGMRRQPLQAVSLVKGRLGPGRPPAWLIRLKGVHTREQAEVFQGCSLLVSPEERPELEEEEFYSPDLIGLDVVLKESGETVGKILDIGSAGNSELLRVEITNEDPPAGTSREDFQRRQVWVPFVKEIVPVVNVEQGLVEITPPKGLLDLGKPSATKLKRLERSKALQEERGLRRKLSLVRKRYVAAGQQHAMEGLWGGGDVQSQHAFADQLLDIHLPELEKALQRALRLDEASRELVDARDVKPPPPFPSLGQSRSASSAGQQQEEEWTAVGLRLAAEGRVAALVLAGGRGTRLGPRAPPAKGMLDIGLPNHSSLFALQAEAIRRVQEQAEQASSGGSAPVAIPWIVMTSHGTDKATKTFFEENAFFGLKPSQVTFIQQKEVATVTSEPINGKHLLLLESPQKVATSPGGNGAVFETLESSGALKQLKAKGVEYLQVYAVDNALVKVADPLFYGYCHERNADVGVKVVTKTDPTEPVGVLCLRTSKESSAAPEPGNEELRGEVLQESEGSDDVGHKRGGQKVYTVLEYSEMPEELQVAREGGDAAAPLKYRAAHICVNVFSVAFLEALVKGTEKGLPYHVAKKRVQHVVKSEQGEWTEVTPEVPNGIKLEKFIFDAFKFAHPSKVAVLEVERDDEFAPIKYTSGSVCTPELAKSLFLAREKKIQQ